VNGGVFVASFSGRLVVSGSPPNSFNGGAPAMNNGHICVSETAPQTFVHGLGYMNDGRLCVTYGGVIQGSSRAGLPMTSDGRVAVSAGLPIASYNHGLPMDAAGRISLENQPGTGPLPPAISGFDMKGFTNGYGS
jgi:hypothetical protein